MILDAQTAVITNANQNEQGKVQKLTEIQKVIIKKLQKSQGDISEARNKLRKKGPIKTLERYVVLLLLNSLFTEVQETGFKYKLLNSLKRGGSRTQLKCIFGIFNFMNSIDPVLAILIWLYPSTTSTSQWPGACSWWAGRTRQGNNSLDMLRK